MKKVLFLMMSLVALTSCKVDMNGWKSNLIDASDNVVTKAYNLSPFEEVRMNCAGKVQLIQSDTKDGVVELTAPDNYIELYKFESEGGRLNIDFRKHNINIHTKDVIIKVYTTNLTKIQNSGVGAIEMDKLDTDLMDIVNSGVGSINISGIADNVKLINSGVGSINASDLKALNVKAIVSGVGSISCYASEKIDGKVSGVGSLKYGGNPKHKNNKRSGVGSISEM